MKYRELRCGLCGKPVIDRLALFVAVVDRRNHHPVGSKTGGNHCQCQTVGGDEFKEWEKAMVVVDEGIVHVTEEERCSLQTREEKA